jgi:hypothetical protein
MLANHPHLAPPLRMSWSYTSESPLCQRRHFMASLPHSILYLTPHSSNGNTIEPSVLLCYLYVHTFTHENFYDLDRSGGRKNEIVKCLCLETDESQWNVYYVKKRHVRKYLLQWQILMFWQDRQVPLCQPGNALSKSNLFLLVILLLLLLLLLLFNCDI